MFNFTPSTIPSNVFVIGAGGTGGRLIPMLSQFMRSITRGNSPTGWLESPRIWLIDDDIVEQKNIMRQNFIDKDVGKHKAAVLADRYTKAYGVDIVPLMMRVTSEDSAKLHQSVNDYLYIKNNNRNVNFQSIVGNSIVVICVDSVQARRDILNNFIMTSPDGHPPKTFFVDAGNEDNFGQVTFFTPTIVKQRVSTDKAADEAELPKMCPVSHNVDYIPMDINYYRDLVDTPAQGSCADLNQTLAINAIMATTIMGVLQNYFYRKTMSYCGVSISLNGGNYTTHNTFFDFNRRGASTKEVTEYTHSQVYVEEKGGSKTRLLFPMYCQVITGSSLRDQLVKKMASIKAEQERQARLAAEKAAEEAYLASVKVIAERKRAEIKAAVARRIAEKAARERGETVEPASTASEDPFTPPPLVARPRTRAARTVVSLPVPDSWNTEENEENE